MSDNIAPTLKRGDLAWDFDWFFQQLQNMGCITVDKYGHIWDGGFHGDGRGHACFADIELIDRVRAAIAREDKK